MASCRLKASNKSLKPTPPAFGLRGGLDQPLYIRDKLMPRVPQRARSGEAARSIYQMKITLIDSQPPIWRRVQVESGVRVDRLHHTLQIVMGWSNSHMHGFRMRQRPPARIAFRLASRRERRREDDASE